MLKATGFAIACAAAVLGLPSTGAAATPYVIGQVKNDTSASLASLAGSSRGTVGPDARLVPRPTGPALTTAAPDPVAQTPAVALSGVTAGLNFRGQSASDTRALLGVAYVPPDTNAAVGTKQIVQTVNVTFTVYDKATGAVQLGPALLTDLWQGFGGLCETIEGGDPVVVFDRLANRWIVSQLAFSNDFSQNFQCIAVSTTADATGQYNRYAYAFGSTLNDYPKFGVWSDAYYYTANMFAVSHGSFTFAGALACAFDRAAMIKGRPANAVCFQNPPSVASLLPASLDSSSTAFGGEPDFFAGLADTTHLNLFRFHVDFGTPANSTFTGGTIAVAPYSEVCAFAISRACIPEPAPGENVDSLGDRVMFRLAYRNFGDHESLVVNHTIAGGALAGVRWYEIRNPGTSPALYQQGTVVDPSASYWMGSIAMDKAGNTALGFSASSKSLDPSVFVVGRAASDPPGSMSGPLSIVNGTGVQLPNSYNRWGDYSSMVTDPTDDCTFWYTQEYYETSGVINWTTRIASFRFASCR